MRRILMVAYHYPPEGSSSGVQRTLAFSRYLPDHRWTPTVLTANARAYAVTRPDQMADVPNNVVVRRAFALDAARHLAVRGRYLSFTALPDRWVTWWVGAVTAALSLLRRLRPQIIWSTYPIATAHLIGWTLQRLSRLPWVADFRDTMTEDDYPPDERQRRVYRWIESKAIERCSKAVFTTPGAVRMYADRYPDVPRHRFVVIANGYDEESFVSAEEMSSSNLNRASPGQTVLLHSGVLYPSERDPRCFYGALAALVSGGELAPADLRVVLRATGHDDHHRRLIEENGLEDVVVLEGAIPYREALREMMDVDGLLVFQASNCNHQIPAKIYEYFRARRPILALTDPRGDTAAALREMGFRSIAPLDDEVLIRQGLMDFLEAIKERRAHVATADAIGLHSRRARSRELARILDELNGASDPR